MSSQFKRKLTAFTAMLAFISLSGAALAVGEGDVLGNTSNVNIGTSGDRTDINFVTGADVGAVGQVDWNSFNVGKNEHVNFGFSNLSQTIINRVLGGQASEILGKITNSCTTGGNCHSFAQTGKVVLINPAGVMFGQGSTVDLNSFTVSTFDFRGAKNLKGIDDLAQYEQDLKSLSPVMGYNGTDKNEGFINFDSNYTEAFDAAGVTYNKGATQITLNGTEFNHFNADGSVASGNPNKSVAIISDNIMYKDSLIKTGQNFNYISANNAQSMSNVKLITADGVTFGYLGNGYVNSAKIADDTKNVERNITIDNAGLGANVEAIKSGNVLIANKSNNAASEIKVKNSVIKGTKLVSSATGDIMILNTTGDVTIDNTRLESVNTSTEKDGITYKTDNQVGGEIYVAGGGNVTVNNSLLKSAGTTNKSANPSVETAGSVRIHSTGKDVKISNSKILSDGNAEIIGVGEVSIDNSLVNVENNLDNSVTKNLKISGHKGVKIKNDTIDATGNIDIRSEYNGHSVANNIVIESTPDANGDNQTLIIAGGKLSIQGANTRLDNASLAYREIHFYGDGTTGQNNVTVANNTTFSPTYKDTDGTNKVSTDLNLKTNGNFILENAKMKIAAVKKTFSRNPDGTLVDDGTANGISYTTQITTRDANNLTVESTEGNVTSTGSDIHTTGNTTLISDSKNVNLENTTLNADKDINLTASAGSVNIKNNSTVNAGKDVNVTAYDTINFGAQGAAGVNIDNSANIVAKDNIKFSSTNGDINAEKTTMGRLSYGKRLAFHAKGNNNFTSEDSLKAVNVDFKAGGSNNFTTKGDIQFVNSSLESPENNITTTEQGGDVIMNNLTIIKGTADAKDTVTTINAKGNVTTKDVTNSVISDTNEATHTFPQSVEYKTGQTADNQVLDVNQTKVIVKTNVVKDPANPDYGSIILDVKNADNKQAGLELTAENDVYDENADVHEGPEVHINAVDDRLAISKIVTDKLFTDANDKMYAADVVLTGDELVGLPEGTHSKGYIEVRDYKGFNQDNDFTKNPSDFGYTGSYVPDKIVVDGEEVDINKKHTIKFTDTNEDFILIYNRPEADLIPNNPEPEQPEILLPTDADSLINQMKLPREQVEISKTSKVSDNTVDQTSNIMSAAAKVDISDSASSSYDDEDEEDGEE